jgi:hypothetical protein
VITREDEEFTEQLAEYEVQTAAVLKERNERHVTLYDANGLVGAGELVVGVYMCGGAQCVYVQYVCVCVYAVKFILMISITHSSPTHTCTHILTPIHTDPLTLQCDQPMTALLQACVDLQGLDKAPHITKVLETLESDDLDCSALSALVRLRRYQHVYAWKKEVLLLEEAMQEHIDGKAEDTALATHSTTHTLESQKFRKNESVFIEFNGMW